MVFFVPRAISHIILVCFDNFGRYKYKLVAFAINLPVESEQLLRARTQQPECVMSELVRRFLSFDAVLGCGLQAQNF